MQDDARNFNSESKDVDPKAGDQDDVAGYFGDCPICHKNDGYLNVGRNHWFICTAHKTKWCIGANLFSSAMDETPEQQRREQEELGFASFAVVEPFHPPPPSASDVTTDGPNDRQLEPEQAAAKAALLAECKALAAAGITFVAVHFDGSGDDGVTEDVSCYKSEDYDCNGKPVEYDATALQDHFEALVPWGFEINEGGFGDVVLDVKARKITVEHNERIEDYVTTTYEI
jgi:hypothetical protein